MADNIDIILDADNEDAVQNGDFAIGEGTMDDCKIIIGLNTGALKSDPLLGPNLIQMMNSYKGPTEIKQEIKLHLNRDNKYPKKLDIVNGYLDIKL